MKLIRALFAICFMLSVFGGLHAEQETSSATNKTPTLAWMEAGARKMQAGSLDEALALFQRTARFHEDANRDNKARIYAARTPAETLAYLLQASIDKQGDAQVVAADWAYAYFLQAYIFVGRNQYAEAKPLLAKAISLSPKNSVFLSELGHVYQAEKNWPGAMESFRAAEAAAEFSPPASKSTELSRAWRGIGFALIEQGQLDDAEKLYRKCLELNPRDAMALNELRYIEGLRAKQRPSGATD